MEREEKPATVLCAGGCGFFGNAANENLCSKCFRERESKRQKESSASQPQAQAPVATPAVAAAAAASVPPPASPSRSSSSTSSFSAPVTPVRSVEAAAATAAAAAAAAAPITPSPAKEKHRCFTCRKNVGLLGFKCRCEQEFCALHRQADQHQCSFDYKSFDRQKLEKANPTVAPQKIQKI